MNKGILYVIISIGLPLFRKTQRGEHMKKLGFSLLFFTFYQLITVVIASQFYWVYKMVNGGVGGNFLSQIHWLVWFILAIEFVISLYLISKEDK